MIVSVEIFGHNYNVKTQPSVKMINMDHFHTVRNAVMRRWITRVLDNNEFYETISNVEFPLHLTNVAQLMADHYIPVKTFNTLHVLEIAGELYREDFSSTEVFCMQDSMNYARQAMCELELADRDCWLDHISAIAF